MCRVSIVLASAARIPRTAGTSITTEEFAMKIKTKIRAGRGCGPKPI
jgi:hypothetical protein